MKNKNYEISYNDKLFKEVTADSFDDVIESVVGASTNIGEEVNACVSVDYEATYAEVNFISKTGDEINTKICIKGID